MNVIGEHGMRAGPRKISGKTVGEHMGISYVWMFIVLNCLRLLYKIENIC